MESMPVTVLLEVREGVAAALCGSSAAAVVTSEAYVDAVRAVLRVETP
jgi:hypothetical protein